MQLQTLKKRSEFQRVRGGGRYSCAAFVMEGKPRNAAPALPDPSAATSATDQTSAFNQARFGFTITKKIGNAVVRNRIRRRLRAALSELAPTSADQQTDYVVIARLPAHTQPYRELVACLQTAFHHVRNGKPNNQRTTTPQQPKKV